MIEEFAKLSKEFFEEAGSPLKVIQNPGTTVTEKTDLAMGVFGGYREHLLAYFMRLWEEMQLRGVTTTVSNGTIIENIAHAGVEFETVMLGLQNSGLVTPTTEQDMQKIQATMATMTFLLIDGFRYNFAFYIPLAEKVIIPGQEEETMDDRHAKRVDAAILSIFDNFNLGIQRLDQPTVEEKAQEMFDTIKRIMTDGYVVTSVVVEESDESEEDPESDATLTE